MQKVNQQLVNFNKGFITEANPLIQPVGSTIDEVNFTLEQNGTRKRRFGMGPETGSYSSHSHAIQGSMASLGSNSFKWDLTGIFDGLYVIVVQLNDTLYFFQSKDSPLSKEDMGSVVLAGGTLHNTYSLTQVNNTLIVATGENIYAIEYENTFDPDDFTPIHSFPAVEVTLEVRDFFGVEDFNVTLDKHIDRGNEISYRPPVAYTLPEDPSQPTTTPAHGYNLVNQGWSTIPTWVHDGEGTEAKNKRLCLWYCAEYNNFFPSNADIFTQYVVSKTDADPKEVEAFIPSTMESGVQSNFAAPKGKTVLKLLDRGERRNEVLDEIIDPIFGIYAPEVPEDKTPHSASVVCEFAGRVCYAGFSGKIEDGDDRSPSLNNYVAFSQLVTYKGQASQCFQVADPTNSDDSEIVDTDGGLIRVTGATNIVGLKAVSNSLLIFAENGVWQVLGGSDYGFTAVNYQVIKVSDRGCIAPKSIVEVNEAVFYWSGDGIYLLNATDNGFYIGQDITRASIKSFYSSTPNKAQAFGMYDDYDKTVRWLVDDQELIYRIDFKAWTKNSVKQDDVKLLSLVEVRPFVSNVNGDGSGDTYTKVEVKYLAYDVNNNTFTFSEYNNDKFIDWEYEPTYATDANAYMIGSHFTGGFGNRRKQTPYVTFHFLKTERGFDEEYEPIGASSCLVNFNWDWSNHQNANKTSREFQAYRFRRHYMPEDNLDGFDNGYETVVTKNKVRGSGKALNVTLKTEPLKDCQVIGWEQEIAVEK